MKSEDEPKRHGDAIRPITERLLRAVLLDMWPDHTAIVDFGIDSQAHYEALYYPIRAGEITPEALDAALGHGRKLTELVQRAPSNPHHGLAFQTSWDVIFGRVPAPPSPEFPQPERDVPCPER